MKPLLFSLLCLSLMAGCKKDEEITTDKDKTCPTKCTVLPVRVSFSDSFSWEEIDAVILKKYTYGSGFTQLEGEITYTLADTFSYFGETDFPIRGFKDMALTETFDYEIVIPATGHIFRLSDMVAPEVYEDFGCGKVYSCYAPMSDLSVSGGEYERRTLSSSVYIQLKKN